MFARKLHALPQEGMGSVHMEPSMAAHSILVVEDDPLQQELTVIALHKVGVTEPVQCVSSGNAAISYIHGDREYVDRERFPRPTLVITDLQMPDGDGYSLLMYLQDHPDECQCRVAVFSSADDEVRIEKAKRLGASRYIVKPASLEAMCRLLDGLVHEAGCASAATPD
jgi:CheY-like chemotaxis protein